MTATDSEREAVHTAYQWAWQVQQDRRLTTSAIMLFCAKTVQRICDSADQHENTYQALAAELNDWRSREKKLKSPALTKAIATLGIILDA